MAILTSSDRIMMKNHVNTTVERCCAWVANRLVLIEVSNTCSIYRMVSPRALAGISFSLRLFILILSIVAMILILTAPGACFSRYLNGQPISREICPGQNTIFPMNADRWSNALHFQGRGEKLRLFCLMDCIYGQVALIVITLVLSLITVAISCVHLAAGHNLTYAQLFASFLSLVAFLVCGGVETWYATGFDHMGFFIMAIGNGVFSGCAGLPGCQIQFVVKGWAVAAAFYFLSGVLYLIDMGLVFARKDKFTADNYPVSRPQHY
uniref:MARVEL domain-containing protein n=1 Tax=Heterorhabditis bacteriophora TaxID=37862 RepID=A0A1I7XHU7_HETBA